MGFSTQGFSFRWRALCCVPVPRVPGGVLVRQLLSLSLVAVWLSVGIRHGLQLAGTIPLWLAGLNIGQDCLMSQCTVGSRDQWGFPSSTWGHRQSFCTVLTAGQCLQLRLCKETVKESMSTWTNKRLANQKYADRVRGDLLLNDFVTCPAIYIHLKQSQWTAPTSHGQSMNDKYLTRSV